MKEKEIHGLLEQSLALFQGYIHTLFCTCSVSAVVMKTLA